MTVVRDGEVTVAAAAGAGVRRAGRRWPRRPWSPSRAEGAGHAPSPEATRWSGSRRRCCSCQPRSRPTELPALHRLRAGGRHRLLRHRQRAPRPAHAADVGDQRDQRHHRRRRAAAARRTTTPSVTVLAFVGDPVASINIFGGFPVTRRMLGMFSKEPEPDDAPASAAPAAYIVAGAAVHPGLAGLSKHETAQRGNAFGIVGMAIALVATLWPRRRGSIAAIGVVAAGRRGGDRRRDRPVARAHASR